MYIESIRLEGFKSYAVTTTLNGLDRNFNAITGLNGTGKSNILDGICFVLGITRLDRVRVKSLKDLICKNSEGEHRNKASVTITFNNTDPTNKPIFCDTFAKICITRQINKDGHSKYILNNTNFQTNKIQDLFKSVQLNVNNPHFLIMQGRITQVINMKPPELLSMLEEAAGTSLYEEKKLKSLKIIKNKNAKLAEIERRIRDDISPTLEKLVREKDVYLKFKSTERRYEELKKKNKAFKFTQLLKECESFTKQYEEMKALIKRNEETIVAKENEMKALETLITQLHHEEDGSEMNVLDEAFTAASKAEAQAGESLKQLKNNIKEEGKKREDTEKGLHDDKMHMEAKEKTHNELEEKYRQLKIAYEKAEKDLADAEKRVQDVHSGLFTTDKGESASLEEQLRAKSEEIANANSQIQQSEMRLKHDRNELTKKQRELANTSSNYNKDRQAVDTLKAQINKLEKEMGKVEAHGQKAEQLRMKHKTLEVEVQKTRTESDHIQRKIQEYVFSYDDPLPNFNRSKIKGTIAENFSVKDPYFSVALEVAGGGKMRNVIVDETETGKLLIKRKCVRTRTTFIPLDKIQPSGLIDEAQVRKAQELVGKDNVWAALSLIEYSNDVATAMKFAFGGTFICRNLDLANKVCFNPAIKKKVVTLQGDVCDPSGIMSGGSRRPTEALNLMKEWRSHEAALKGKHAELVVLAKQLQPLLQSAQVYESLKSDLEEKKFQLQLEERRLASTSHHSLEQEVKELKKRIEDGEASIKENKTVLAEGKKRLAEMKEDFKNADVVKKKAQTQAENHLKQCQKADKAAKANWGNKEQETKCLELEIADLKKGILNGEAALKACDEALRQYQERRKELEEEYAEKKAAMSQAKTAVEKKKDEIRKYKKEVESKIKEKEKLKQGKEDLNLENKKLGNELDNLQRVKNDVAQQIARKRRDDAWIKENEQYFGMANTEFTLDDYDEHDAIKELEEIKEQYEKIKKNVNPEAMKELGNTEMKYHKAIAKKKRVLKDKEMILKVIEDLDAKKKVKLRDAFEQVNVDLQDNFSTFLNDAKAELVTPNGGPLESGLEFRVSFGEQVRSSTTELSGGQKSLVALSLILSLLQLNPAPIYILDEIDSALDLAHTQNIGSIIKKKFKQSQFIIVSLKEGMFSNANVLYRTKFQQGTSQVTRIAT